MGFWTKTTSNHPITAVFAGRLGVGKSACGQKRRAWRCHLNWRNNPLDQALANILLFTFLNKIMRQTVKPPSCRGLGRALGRRQIDVAQKKALPALSFEFALTNSLAEALGVVLFVFVCDQRELPLQEEWVFVRPSVRVFVRPHFNHFWHF